MAKYIFLFPYIPYGDCSTFTQKSNEFGTFSTWQFSEVSVLGNKFVIGGEGLIPKREIERKKNRKNALSLISYR